MERETLFRVGLKLIGVWLVAAYAQRLLSYLFTIVVELLDQRQMISAAGLEWWQTPLGSAALSLGYALVPIVIGLYLFFGGELVVQMAMDAIDRAKARAGSREMP